MDSIRQAVDLARTGRSGSAPESPTAVNAVLASSGSDDLIGQVQLSAAHLETHRIIAHGATGTQGEYYDMLRVQVLQALDKNGWQILAVTSPTASCGKTVTACNLAMSIAGFREKSVLLIDMDLRKPKVSQYLGIKRNDGLLAVLEGRATLRSKIIQASIGRSSLLVLPGEVSEGQSSEWMASQTMTNLLHVIKREFRSHVIIIDLPPMLTGDEVISILPHVDALLMVAGVGITSISDIKECQKHLTSTPIVRIVVNKVVEKTASSEGYY